MGEQIVPIQGAFAEIGRQGDRNKESRALDAAYFHLPPESQSGFTPRYSPIPGRTGIDMLDAFYFFLKMIDLNNTGLVPLIEVDRG